MIRFLLLAALFMGVIGSTVVGQDRSATELMQAAVAALKAKMNDDAIALAGKAIDKDPKAALSYLFRSGIFETLGRYQDALKDLDQVLVLDPKLAETFQQRGTVHFKLGHIKESIADFDRYIELRPDAKVSHWQRGISYYYAGRFDEGRQQFEGYQTFDSNDVENAVWRFLCMARKDGIAKARQDMLKIGDDKRVPMRQVYDLYAGKLKPAEVLAAAVVGDPGAELKNRQLFYAHLYVGIYYEIEGDKKKAFEHLEKAAQEHRIGHYMWDVARVHRDILKKELEKK